MNNKKFAIVILNWNGIKDTIDCINSILICNYSNFKIFCLDNGSKKREDMEIKKIHSKKLEVIRSEKNVGFAEGNNYVCSKINLNNFKYVFLLNNDTIVKKDFFENVNDAINKNKNKSVGIFIPTIFYYNSELKEDLIWRADDFKRISKQNKLIKYPTGCAIVIKSEVIQKYGLFNMNFFAYGEELEYFYRLNNQGIKILYIPKAIIWHKVIEAKDSQFKIYMMSRNKWYYWKLMRFKDKLFYLPYILFIYNLKKLISYAGNIKNLKTFVKGNFDGIIWILTGIKPRNLNKLQNISTKDE